MAVLGKKYEKQFGFGKTKAGLTVCAVLVVILASSSVWLYTRINSLENQIDAYSHQIDSLEESKLHMLGDKFFDLFPQPYVGCSGIVFNSGTNTAYNVVITWNVYDGHGTLIATRNVSCGHIEGKSYEIVDVDIECHYVPDWVTYEMTWDYAL